MTITIEIAPEEEARLREKAARQGQDVDSYLQALAQREAAPIEAEKSGKKQTLATSLADLIGSVDSSLTNGGQVSHAAENVSEEFTNYVLEKHKAGRL